MTNIDQPLTNCFSLVSHIIHMVSICND